MKLAAYQFGVTGCIADNLNKMLGAIGEAASQGVSLIVFPECAVTGYPHYDMASAGDVNADAVEQALGELQDAADRNGIHVLVGTVARYQEHVYNRAYFLSPGEPAQQYGKRALYGWDSVNFMPGSGNGVFEIDGVRIGVRICFEVRFPEFFRELYRERTDLNIVLFYDTSAENDLHRYELLKSHLLTRAVENVTPVLSVNSIGQAGVPATYQTAPTCMIDASGNVLAESERNVEGMLVYDFSKRKLNFGEIGRKLFSDKLTGRSEG